MTFGMVWDGLGWIVVYSGWVETVEITNPTMFIVAGPCQDRPASFSDESRRGRGPQRPQPHTFQDLNRFGVYPKIMVVNLP